MPEPPPATPRRPTVVEAALPLAAAAALLAVGYAALGWRIEVMLLAAAAVAGLVGRRGRSGSPSWAWPRGWA